MRKIVLLFFVFYFQINQAQISDFNNINFTIADNIAKLNEGESLKNLPLLSYKLTSKLETDVEKFRAIYSWVSTNIKGDGDMHNKVTRKRKKLKKDSVSLKTWNETYKKRVFKTLVNKKRTMCTGYAYLIKEMSNISGIECRIIDGYGRTVTSNIDTLDMPNHSWNAVKINKKWYLCDATWSSGYMNEKGLFIKDYNDGYFLTHPNLFNKNHFPLNKKWLLSSTQSKSFFTKAPLVYGEIFKHKLLPIQPKEMKIKSNKNKTINFVYELLNEDFSKNISLVYFLGGNEKKLKIYNLEKKGKVLKFKHNPIWKNNYDAHLKIGNDIVATYIIKTSK